MQFIDLKTQYQRYQTEIDARMKAVLDHGKFIMGPEIAEMEQTLAEYVGVEHCISVSSGTHSLEIALRALDIGPGDEVVTVPFTWISSAEVIMLVGATPVFVDIEPAYFNLDVQQLEKAITSGQSIWSDAGLRSHQRNCVSAWCDRNRRCSSEFRCDTARAQKLWSD